MLEIYIKEVKFKVSLGEAHSTFMLYFKVFFVIENINLFMFLKQYLSLYVVVFVKL